jgi:glycosyltransferase involved in cell wall biosynthesis
MKNQSMHEPNHPESDYHPVISVVVPVYKVEKYLRRCVDSIIGQTWQALEIILVDDGSPDNSGSICDEYALSDPRVKVIHKQNGGLSDARNTGIEIATGAYIGFVDSDDFIHAHMFESLYEKLIKSGADISQCSFRTVTGDETVDPGEKKDGKKITPTDALNIMYTPFGVDYVVAWNKLYKKSLFNEIRFPKSRIHEDEATTWKLLYASSAIIVSEEKYYYYFQSPGSITRGVFSEKKLDYAEAIEEKIAFFKSRDPQLAATAQVKYALWLLYFSYQFKQPIRKQTGLQEKIADKYNTVVSDIRKNPQIPSKTRFILKVAKAGSLWAGYLVYNQFFRNNLLSRLAEGVGLK